MITLPEATFDTDLAIEQRDIRHGPAEKLMTLRGQDSLNVDPWIGLLALK